MTTAADALALPIDLAELILARCVHAAAIVSLWQPSAIAQPLNVLSRTHVPLVTKAAFMQVPAVDLDWVTKCGDLGLLNFMLQWSKQPKGRPLNYSPVEGVLQALESGNEKVLEWWLDTSGLILDWDWSRLSKALCSKDGMRWLAWWKTRGFPYLEDRVSFPQLFVEVARVGRVDMLDWLLENVVGVEQVLSEPTLARAIMVTAAAKGHVPVLAWWAGKVQGGAIPTALDLIEALEVALRENQVGVLEWCAQQPAPAELYLLDTESRRFSMGEYAAKNGLLHWFDAFGFLKSELTTSKITYERASIAACEKGDLVAVRTLLEKECLAGSRVQLLRAALASDNLDLLDWIHRNYDLSTVDMANQEFFQDSYLFARVRKASTLDWFLEHGYVFPAQGQSLGSTFDYAVLNGDVSILDWLLKHTDTKNMSKWEWAKCFSYASDKGFIHVLEWLVVTISNLTAQDGEDAFRPIEVASSDQATSSVQSTFPFRFRVLHRSFCTGQVEVIDWWLHKSGPYKDWFDLNHDHPYLNACESHAGAAHLSALQAWFAAGWPMNFAKCINVASINGRIDVLDWLLKPSSVAEEHFQKAWTSEDFPDEDQWCRDWWYDEEHHGGSLLWWWANLPHVCALPMNRGPLKNPIHAHLLTHMLKNTSFEMIDPPYASGDYGGMVPALMYWKQHGDLEQLQDDCQWSLENASREGYCHVLEWWKRESGIAIAGPGAIGIGPIYGGIDKRAKQWWAASGLASEAEVARMTTGAWYLSY